MAWHIRKADVEFFRRELWKDSRSFPVAVDEHTFAKDCFSAEMAEIEANALILLNAQSEERLTPQVRGVEGSKLFLERIQGIRLFDLIRHLRRLEFTRQDNLAHSACQELLGRCGVRLDTIQRILHSSPILRSSEPYPLDEKLYDLLSLFLRILGVQSTPMGWQDSLADLASLWGREYALVPFRDATTKNIIVRDPRLIASDASDEQRCAIVEEILTSETPDYWRTVEIVDVDFSSVVHLTSPEDDPISLFCHEWTFGSRSLEPAAFLLSDSISTPNRERCAASFIVRYLRFGGRKLAYQIINSQGFKVRFAYDDPLFYFRQLPIVCDSVAGAAAQRYEPLLQLVTLIADTYSHSSAANRSLLSVDHLRRYYPSARYWQENPDEIY